MGRGRRDKIYLTAEQRQNFKATTHNGYAPAKKILHAQVLLMCDEGELALGKWSDEEIARTLNIHRNSVGRIRKRFREQGEFVALTRKPRCSPPVAPKVDGQLEAQIIALCCSEPPEGYAHWSLRLLTQELKKRSIVVEISRETVRRTLKKQTATLESPTILHPPARFSPFRCPDGGGVGLVYHGSSPPRMPESS
jgi:transposase